MLVGSLKLVAIASVSSLLFSVALHSSTPVAPVAIPGADTPENAKTMGKLSSIIIPMVNFDKLDSVAVFDYLAAKSKECDPEHIGVKFRFELPSQSKSKSPPLHREVSITLDKVPLGELLAYICVQTHLTYKIVKGEVVFAPGTFFTPDPPDSPTIKH